MLDQVRYACEWTSVGIGVAAQRCVRALAAHAESDGAFDLAWEPLIAAATGRTRTQTSAEAASWLRALRRPERERETLILHSVPGEWKSVAQQLQPRHQIGHSVWELDDVPSVWIDQMSEIDEFWVPTRWNQAAFERAFDRPVHVVPHIVSDVEPASDPMAIAEELSVVSVISAWDWRKRPDRAIEAFCHAFTGDDPVALAVKTTPWHVGWPGEIWNVPEVIHRITERFSNPPAVYYDTSHWSDAQMMGLAARSVCTLSMTASEGWGLGTFDAAALGVPAIITGYGGQLEYLGDDYPGLLPYRRVKTAHADRDLFEHGTEWAHPDMDAAVDLLRSVVSGTAPELVNRSKSLAGELRERYCADVVGAQMASLLSNSFAHATPSAATSHRGDEAVVVLTPIKNAAHHASGYVDRLLALSHPQLRVAVLVSDSTDGSADAFRTEFRRLDAHGIAWAVYEQDFGYEIPQGAHRHDASLQLERRLVLARSRNHLLMRGLGDADWALWVDVDVVEYPTDVIEQLLRVGGDVVHPHCINQHGRTFDLNAWTDHGRHHLDDYVDHQLVELHAVGGTMLLVRADRHRDGLTWPAYRHGAPNDRIRTEPELLHRPEVGEVETEGLGMLAHDMGIACWGLPQLTIRHE